MSDFRVRLLFQVMVSTMLLMLVSCRAPATADVPLTFQPTAAATETAFVPTPLPPEPETLIVCLADEPESLFLYHPAVQYGEASAEANTILQAIYNGPIDIIDYRVEPVILEDLPTLENGGVSLEPVTIAESEVYFNPQSLQPENLGIGDRYLPQGCDAPECLATYSGGEVQMDQMVVEFKLRAGVLWSDGQPLSASDSLFSYTLDRRGELPTTKFLVDRTAEYRVMDELTIRWVGIPGFMDSDFQTNFWPPLPQHILGELPVSELLDAQDANRRPIGWGPYVIESWDPGEITLTPNPNYSGFDENLPGFDRLYFRFIEQHSDGALQQVLTDECDIVDESLLEPADYQTALELQSGGKLKVWTAPEAQLVRLDFNLSPVDANHPAFFEDRRTRQALAQCIDRPAIQLEYGSDSTGLPQTYINVLHPAASTDVELVSFDPGAGQTLLDEIGWVLDEDNPDSPRVAFGVPGVRMATPLSVSLVSVDTAHMQAIAAEVASNLDECGVSVAATTVPPDEIGAPWPDGPAFGRSYDLMLWSWPEWVSPLCEMFVGWEIPSSTQPYGVNATGYRSDAYDEACMKTFLSIPGTGAYEAALFETQQIFSQDLPSLPIFQPLRWVVSDNETCGLALDGLSTSALWNIEVLDSGDSCP